MILAHLMQDLILPPLIAQAVEHLRQNDYTNFAVGRHQINETMFALVQDPVTQDWEQGMPEFHRRHIDVQCLLIGEETIGYLPPSTDYNIEQDFLEERDIAFISPQADESRIVLRPNMYAVFFPGELHRPCRSTKTSQQIKKVVVKIRI